MTQFNRSSFVYDCRYLQYPVNGELRFVARFKHCPRDKPGFLSFLIKNFTVEEYFEARDRGDNPEKILEARGYVSKTVQEACLREGYPATQEGFRALVEAQVKRSTERLRTEGKIHDRS